MVASDALLLARAQFGLNIGFHILFPTLTITLAWFLLYFRVRYARSGDAQWLAVYKLWVKVFALTFAMGVVSGITMSFQFGTNWPGYMLKVGAVAGPLLAYEVLTAFFLEATFLGIMLFGMNRVPSSVHIFSATMVAGGTTLSAFWILALNSWMQTPAGFAIDGGQVIAADWLAVIFNPSFPYRFAHMLIASGLTGAFVIIGLSAWRLLRADDDAATKSLRAALIVAAVLAPIQIFVGDSHGLNTLAHQPAKIAGIEAIWKTGKGVPLVLFAIPNPETQTNDYAVEIPKGASWILKHDADAELKGLDAFVPDTPPVAPLFFAFRAMVGLGAAMLAIAWFGGWLVVIRRRKPPRLLLWIFSAFTFAGWGATLCGWLVTEIGRQPWLVTGLLRTADATGKVSEGALGASLTGYVTVYALMFTAYMVVLTHLARKGSQT